MNAFVEYRSGPPYSPVDETLEFIGPRNQTRFPAYTLLEQLTAMIQRQQEVIRFRSGRICHGPGVVSCGLEY